MSKLHRAMAGLAAVGVLVCTPALAEDPAPNPHSVELVRKLFTEMRTDTLMGDMIRQMAPAMMAQARQRNPNLSAADAQAISDATSASMDAMMKKMIDRSVPLYASTFSEKELQDLVDFYDTPTGRAMLVKMPVLMSKMAPIAAGLAPEMVADMTQRICARTDCSKRAAPVAPKS
jgi:hypothetical protein